MPSPQGQQLLYEEVSTHFPPLPLLSTLTAAQETFVPGVHESSCWGILRAASLLRFWVWCM